MTEERIYPIRRRSEALAITNLFSNCFASLSPMINEIEEPWPIVCLLVVVLMALPLGLTIDVPTVSPLEPARKQQLIAKRYEERKKRKQELLKQRLEAKRKQFQENRKAEKQKSAVSRAPPRSRSKVRRTPPRLGGAGSKSKSPR